MSMIFRASAIEFGFNPEFEIVLEQEPLIDYAFTVYLREAREGSERAALLDRTVRSVLALRAGGRFPWDPASALREEMRSIAGLLDAQEETTALDDLGGALGARERESLQALERVEKLAEASGLERNSRSTLPRLLALARAGRFPDLFGQGMATVPVKKAKPGDRSGATAWEEVAEAWADADAAVSALASCWSRSFYGPLLRLYDGFTETLEKAKRAQARIFIGDIGRALAASLSAEVVPEIYFRLGERIWHFLVDEFQDTSPRQWRTLLPLVENSLAAGGTLFVVGDTKQAIYGFRGADYRIMRGLEEASPFASADRRVEELTENYRSRPRVIELAAEVFRVRAAGHPEYGEAVHRAGLDAWTQEAVGGADPGYAEIQIVERDDEAAPEKGILLEAVRDARSRGWRWGDIAILATRNEDIVRATSWLNESGIPFLSYSSLDVRSRRVAEEMLALLAFLDSPPDDLSFATFVLGDIFAAAASSRPGWPGREALHELLFRSRHQRPLYKAFQAAFPAQWKAWFASLFRAAGYLPLYDLVSEAVTSFSVFERAAGEEATIAKLLESVKDFEGTGGGSLRGFLDQASGETARWEIEVPRGADSVRAMTVHKAKGLGFPVVIALLYGGTGSAALADVLREDDGTPRLVRITEGVADRDPRLRALRDEDAMRRKVDSLNALYVALTRARREMYVIGARRKRDTFPFDILPEDLFRPGGPGKASAPPSAEAEPLERLSHETRPSKLEFAGGGPLSREERRRGEDAHRMLQLLGAEPGDLRAALTSAAARTAREAREDSAAAESLVPALSRLIEGTELAPHFRAAENRQVFTEQEFCDAAGRLFRMDRVVVDPGRVTVIDFKTGAEAPAEHEKQLRDYMAILADVYPGREISGIVGYVDLGTARSFS
jgi:ATP-dependent exoDNAse (exonuclease V) beta subunit